MNRQEAIEYIQEWLKDEYALNGKDRVVLNIAIEALRDGWIPVSERLPEIHVAVLVWCPERRNIFCASCDDDGTWNIFGAYQKVSVEVTAWKPLPEPYREREE